MAGRYLILYLCHFLVTILAIDIFHSIVPDNVSNCFLRLSKLLMGIVLTKLTLGISKKTFCSERLKPHLKAVLITGCARGIGYALAKHLDAKGFHVFASCRDPQSPGAEDLKKSCSSRLQVLQLDVANDESVQTAVKFVKDNLSACELWAIINNAGIQKGFLLELSSIQDFKDSLEVNALGPARVTKAFLPLLRQSRGRVINMGSIVGRLAFPMIVPYSMSKFACIGFSESLRYELDLWGVQVISIEPEYFETDMTTENGISKRVDAMLAKLDADVRKEYGEIFIKAFKHRISTTFPPSPKMKKVIETIECAVILKQPEAVYKICRNFGLRATWTLWNELPEEFKVFILRTIFYFFGLYKLGKQKKCV